MSGFVALVGDEACKSDCERALTRIAYRGDTPRTYFESASAVIAHTLRSTTPEAATEVHAGLREDGLVIATDARLDNRDQLIDQLGIASRAAVTDVDLMAAAYLEWGADCAGELLGDFAFVIWDPSARVLFAARDHLGVRPICYALVPGGIAVASEPKALLTHPAVDDRVRATYLQECLSADTVDPGSTAFGWVHKVPPGHTLRFREGDLSVECYWRLEDAPELQLTDAEAAREFRALFTDAVACRLRASGSVAVHLSGGLDSSSVVATAAEVLGQERSRLTAITNAFTARPECDERQFAELVLNSTGIRQHVVIADRRGPLDVLEDVLPELNEPYVGSNHHLIRGLSEGAAATGARVCLDGFDGDAVVSHGFELLSELAERGQWSELNRQVDLLVDRRDGNGQGLLRAFGIPALMQHAREGSLRTALRGAWALGSGRHGRRSDLIRRVARSTAGRYKRLVVGKEASRTPNGEGVGAGGSTVPRPSRTAHLRGLPAGGLARTLEWLDLYGALSGIEVRHPFMDKRLVEFCVGLPARQKLRDGRDRWVAREAMDGLLPDEIRWRHAKGDMTPNFAYGLLHLDADRLAAIVRDDVPHYAEVIDVPQLEEAVADLSAMDPGAIRSADLVGTWRRVATSHVLRRRWPDSPQAAGSSPSYPIT